MKLETYKEKLNEQWERTGLEVAPHTSVNSLLYPGNFCYCLDEIEIYNKYKSFIEIGEEHYQKMQPAIRIADFKKLGNAPMNHLGQFSIATINGFNSVYSEDGRNQYEQSVKNMFGFMNSLGLEQSKICVSYFSGNDAKSIEASRKSDEQKRKIIFDRFIPEDDLREVLLENGLDESQLIPNKTRDNYLTSAWYVTKAPWGYRNEIFYELPKGELLDIGTIERLVAKPIIEKEFFKDRKGYDHIVTDLLDWEMNLLIDATGVERIIQAIEGKDSIFQIEAYKPFMDLGYPPIVIEAGKIAHRVFSDAKFGDLSRHRKGVIKEVIRNLNPLTSTELRRILETNAEVYICLYPELKNTIEKTIEEIEAYRKRCN